MRNIFKIWLPLAIVTTCLAGLVYVVAQQVYRQSADDNPTFTIDYDESGKVISGDYYLHGRIPTPPPGVFDYARSHGEDRVTWQPEPDVRNAIILTYFQNPNRFILTGRSLQETEQHISSLGLMVLLAWFATLILSLGACIFALRL